MASTSSSPVKEVSQSNSIKPTEEEEDPDAVAPASTAGCHAKPLSALMGGAQGVGGGGKGNNRKGKGKGKEGQDEDGKEGFESVLARLMEGNG